ncbi:MAG TPA: condensation domain-containing protein, partial [Blastocatellia bacterium]|nr:condensation domain-containing protein [Blastocatellia bacterium]
MSRAELQGYHLSIQQARAWSFRQSGASACVQCALLLQGPLEVEALKAGLSRIVADNEILRTTFQSVAGLKLPVQVISEEPDYVWRELDVPLPSAPELIETAPEIDSMLREEQGCSFDYQCGPLLRARLLRFGTASHVLALTISALCADSWTLVQISRGLVEFYEEGVGYRDAWFEAPALAPLALAPI